MPKKIPAYLLLLLLPSLAFAFAEGTLDIKTANSTYHFTVEIAKTAEERAQGLMFRSMLPENAGMLFLYPAEESVAFWMRNTPIPLDMLFLGKDGTILQIARNATPLSERPIPSLGPVRAVLEINGGLSDKWQIQPGDKVILPGEF